MPDENDPGISTARSWAAGLLGALGCSAMLAGGVVLALSGSPQPPPAEAAAPTAPVQLPADDSGPPGAPPPQEPGTVRLPQGGTAKLVRKEITVDGTLPIPRGLDDATWWGAKLGAFQGAALLSGHVNWAGVKGPFDELWRVQPGQDVSVVDTAGGHWLYRVSGIVTLHKDDLPAQARTLFGQDGPPRLVLVTCGGDYVGGTDGYQDNRIVTADLVARPG
jgi:hypothetical protein